MATELLSNAAAVALVLPIAAAVATGLGQPPMLFATAVVFAASQSFLSPIGYQTNLMVYAPGRYRFLDFLSFGWPLSLAYTLMVPAADLVRLELHQTWRRGEQKPALLQLHFWNDRLHKRNQYRFAAVELDLQ